MRGTSTLRVLRQYQCLGVLHYFRLTRWTKALLKAQKIPKCHPLHLISQRMPGAPQPTAHHVIPQTISGSQPFLAEMWLIAAVVSSIAYGVEIILAIMTVNALLAKRRHTPAKLRRVLVITILFLCLLGTAGVIFSVITLIYAFVNPGSIVGKLQGTIGYQIFVQPFSDLELIFVVLATWCSYGLLVCNHFLEYFLNHDLSADLALHGVVPRNLSSEMDCVCCIRDSPCLHIPRSDWYLLRIDIHLYSHFPSTGFGFMGLFAMLPNIPWSGTSLLAVFEIVSFFINGAISCLITTRILYHQWRLRRVFGKGYGTAYTRIMVIFIESSLMTFIWDGVIVVVTFKFEGSAKKVEYVMLIILKLLLHLNVSHS